jgi:argininosuccinate lyase
MKKKAKKAATKTGAAKSSAGTAKALWSGRFASGPCESMKAVGDSLRVDRRLVRHDLIASGAHARMLGAQGIIPKKDAKAILVGLQSILDDLEAGKLRVEGADEDVHSWIERTLRERVGDAGARLHTARSRNDQVVTAFRLWLRDELYLLADQDVPALIASLVAQASANADVIVPAYTHMQRGQPVLFAHQLLAYCEMFDRDRRRLAAAIGAAGAACPLGSGAATGVPYPVDRDAVAGELGFDAPSANSMDAVSDRDFAVEALAALALLQVHLSRLAEDVCLWASSEWRLLALGDEVSTGSSIMPQKRNPDGAELTRGKTGRVIGHLTGTLAMLKGLPMTYDRDLQEDKEAVFDAVDTVQTCVHVMTDTIARSRFLPENAAGLLRRGHLLATELADFLVGKGIPFRHAHEKTGAAIRALDERGLDLSDAGEDELVALDADFAGCAAALDFRRAVDRRDHPGGTATRRVAAAIRAWKRRLGAR